MANGFVCRHLIGQFAGRRVVSQHGYGTLHHVQERSCCCESLFRASDGRVTHEGNGALMIFDRELADGDDIRLIGKGGEFQSKYLVLCYSAN